MNNESPIKALIVVIATALVCSILVTVAAVTLQPIQRAYQDLERNRYLVGISGLTDGMEELSDRDIVSRFQALEARIVDLDRGDYDQRYNPATFDTWQADEAGYDSPDFMCGASGTGHFFLRVLAPDKWRMPLA